MLRKKGLKNPQCFALCSWQPSSNLPGRDHTLPVLLEWVPEGQRGSSCLAPRCKTGLGVPAAPKPCALATEEQAVINQGKRKHWGTYLFLD